MFTPSYGSRRFVHVTRATKGEDRISEASLTCQIELLACQGLPTPALAK